MFLTLLSACLACNQLLPGWPTGGQTLATFRLINKVAWRRRRRRRLLQSSIWSLVPIQSALGTCHLVAATGRPPGGLLSSISHFCKLHTGPNKDETANEISHGSPRDLTTQEVYASDYDLVADGQRVGAHILLIATLGFEPPTPSHTKFYSGI